MTTEKAEPKEMIKFFSVNQAAGKKYKESRGMTFLEQEQEARAYNSAFLHGKKVGLKFGREIAINEVLEIIAKDPGGYGACMRIREAVIRLKEGKD